MGEHIDVDRDITELNRMDSTDDGPDTQNLHVKYGGLKEG